MDYQDWSRNYNIKIMKKNIVLRAERDLIKNGL